MNKHNIDIKIQLLGIGLVLFKDFNTVIGMVGLVLLAFGFSINLNKPGLFQVLRLAYV